MDQQSAERLDIDVSACEQNRQIILQHIKSLEDKTRQVFGNHDYPEINDPDAQIYSGGFFSDADYSRMERIRNSPAHELGSLNLTFDDGRLDEMLFRYRARNYPETLKTKDKHRWNEFRQSGITDPSSGRRTLNRYLAEIEALQCGADTTGDQLVILEQLIEYARHLFPEKF